MKPAFALATLLAASLTGAAQPVRQPVDYVDPNIGGVALLLTSVAPTVQVPHGMMRLAPSTTPRVPDRYLATKIFGFPAGAITLMPIAGDPGTTPAQQASEYDHDKETATPFYFSTILEDYGIRVEFTATTHAAYYRITYPGGREGKLVLRVQGRQFLDVSAGSVLRGSGGGRGGASYFYAEFRHPFQSHQSTPQGAVFDAGAQPVVVEMRVGMSYIDAAQAQRNLAQEIPTWDFEKLKAGNRELWNRALGRIQIDGGSQEQRTLFYTCLYRSLLWMTDITEGGRYYSNFDHKVHESEGHDFYVDDGLWDSYRTRHPLQLIVEPARHLDQVWSYLRMYDQSGWLPVFPFMSGERPLMLGNHVAAFKLDTYAKGLRAFDAEKALAGMRKNATEASMLPYHRGPKTALESVYYEKGWFPALGKGEPEPVKDVNPVMHHQAVAVTLENAYDDWAISEMAAALGKRTTRCYLRRTELSQCLLSTHRLHGAPPRRRLLGCKLADVPIEVETIKALHFQCDVSVQEFRDSRHSRILRKAAG